ncbi:cytochrome c family protein [Lacinutrix sp. Hel_I_90]|uniref:cytochrome c family protein n=1 Tax=Lacinutrix sp. Hel_I_90 TaxID=1249999 RepID=UPI000ACC3F02|nr:cytochrome c family protein [Lacinutrix sp. Hel_I_90]
MKNLKLVVTVMGVLILSFVLFVSLGMTSATTTYVAATPSCECTTFDTLYFQGDVPHDSGQIPNQAYANCFAWKEFVALNWPTDGSSNFGDPKNTNKVAWETYMTKEVLMPANGQAPPAWNTTHPLLTKKNSHKRVLMHVSKFTAFNDTIVVTETGQAAPSGSPNWLGTHNNTNLWYEVLVNKDEYDYITDPKHQFYNADKQLSWTTSGNAIHLPKGSNTNTTIGAMEIKAAWMELSSPPTVDVTRYKISEAVIIDPNTGKQRAAKVALIGLHIIHKTESQPTWIWSTFEHVDNAPDNGANPSGGHYNLYNVNCKDKTMEIPAAYSATKKDTTVTISCKDANVSPPYYLGLNGPKPTQLQVTRTTPLDDSSVQVNNTIQTAIKKYYPESVFQYYELVDVIWSSNPVQDTNQPAKVPLSLNSLNPNNNVANSAMETYAQQTKCTDCHQFGSIAGKSNFASDFSFVLSAASAASQN